jgi:hypothetical protein
MNLVECELGHEQQIAVHGRGCGAHAPLHHFSHLDIFLEIAAATNAVTIRW